MADKAQGPANSAANIFARDHANVQVGNNDFSKTFHGGVHNHTTPTHITRETILRDLASHSYRERKDINPSRVPHTCEWFLSHQRYKQWRKHPLSSMLRVSADPGCGKSVLAKYLVDEELAATEATTTCYFFFKDGLGDQSSATMALRCILHQLLSLREDLFSDAVLKRFQSTSYLMTSTLELWDVLVSISADPAAGEIILIFDAFDECSREGRAELEKVLCQFYGKEDSEHKLKVLLTSRPHEVVTRGFRGMELSNLPVLHLAGEDEDEVRLIAKEIDLVIAARVQELAIRLELSPGDAEHLRKRLSAFNNRTYLWVYLTLNVIENADRTDRDGISNIIANLPGSVQDAYEKILQRSSDPIKARKLLEIMMAATRPLSLMEMAEALELEEHHKGHSDLKVVMEPKVQRHLRDLCGLFIIVINSEVFFLHQTAREFLTHPESRVRDVGPGKKTSGPIPGREGDNPDRTTWARTISMSVAHCTLGRLCVSYLLLQDFTDAVPQVILEARFAFLRYASMNWFAHCRQANFEKVPTESLLRLCGKSGAAPAVRLWTAHQEESRIDFYTVSPLMVASYFGVTPAAQKVLAAQPDEAKAVHAQTGRSALSFASEQGFGDIVELLLKCLRVKLRKAFGLSNRHVDNVDRSGQTPLSFAALNGHASVARALLAAGARPNFRDSSSGTPMSYGLCSENEDMVRLMLGEGANTNLLDDNLREILFHAILGGQDRITSRIIGTKRLQASSPFYMGRLSPSNIKQAALFDEITWLKIPDTHGNSPTVNFVPRTIAQVAVCVTSWTALRAFDEIGEPVNVRHHSSVDGTTLLHWAAAYSPAPGGMVAELLSRGAAIDAEDSIAAYTPLHWALWAKNNGNAELLLSRGADPYKVNSHGRSALQMGYWPHVVTVMLGSGVTIPGLQDLEAGEVSRIKEFAQGDTHDKIELRSFEDIWRPAPDVEPSGRGSLQSAASASLSTFRNWHTAFLTRPNFGLARLIAAVACLRGQADVLRSLCRVGLDLRFADGSGRTLLHDLANTTCGRILLGHGLDPDITDVQGRTALHAAFLDARGDMAALLLKHAAYPGIQDSRGITALHEAILQCESSLVISQTGAQMKRAIDYYSIIRTILYKWSTVRGSDRYLSQRIDVNAKDAQGRTALHMAAERGLVLVVEYLLEADADVSRRDLKGNTPLHYALGNGHQDVGDVLMEAAADWTALNDAGEPPQLNGVGFGRSGRFRVGKRVDGPRGS
ncbi:hypothetical protein NLU13_8605 [Sarocladium strictum]|uniref:Uncharacterized protein n=1 Tax=Sarocladium strictum TaxID=5046 RepID=A0AA39GDH8_SARSR|nr:hypothetical protein NLU13_8605 [Sarocladium strictum]